MKFSKKLLSIFIAAVFICSFASVTAVGASASHTHNYENGYCPVCWAADPDYVHPCANGHTMRDDGACMNCSYYNPDYLIDKPDAPDTDDVHNDEDEDDREEDEYNDSDSLVTVIFVICIVLFAILCVLLVLLFLKKKKQKA